MKTIHQAFMASDTNPFTDAPHGVRIQLAAFLGIMWSSTICAGTGVWLLYGGMMFLKALVALGVLMTGLTLHRAGCEASRLDLPLKDHPSSHDNARRG